jgi:hypothetical protein
MYPKRVRRVVLVVCTVFAGSCTQTQKFRPYVPELKKMQLEAFLPGVKFEHKVPDQECEPDKRSAVDKQLDKGFGAPIPGLGGASTRLDFVTPSEALPSLVDRFVASAESRGFVKDKADPVGYDVTAVVLVRPVIGTDPEVTVSMTFLNKPVPAKPPKITSVYLELTVGCGSLLK